MGELEERHFTLIFQHGDEALGKGPGRAEAPELGACMSLGSPRSSPPSSASKGPDSAKCAPAGQSATGGPCRRVVRWPIPERRDASATVATQGGYRRFDLFILFGAYIIFEATQMPWSRGRFQWYASPGLFPTVIGTLLILFSLRVFWSRCAMAAIAISREPSGSGCRGFPAIAGYIASPSPLWIGLYVFYGVGHYNYRDRQCGFPGRVHWRLLVIGRRIAVAEASRDNYRCISHQSRS
jgi:hypothetical protein